MSASRQVPFFNYPALFARDEAQIMETLRDVLSRGAYIMQRDLQQFETSLCDFLGVKHAFGVADGTNAITLALVAAGIEPGDEVIMPSHTFIATAGAAHLAGATPLLADCGPDHMIDTDSAHRLITDKTRAIVPVQLNGRTCDMDRVQDFADQYGLVVVEDAAQALGSKFKGKPAGTFGAAGTFSFYPAKLLGCFGDGGAVVTNDDDVAEQVFALRDHGRDRDGEIRRWGYNSRLDNIQAAVLDMKLASFPAEIARRREIAALYAARLGDLAQLHLPPSPEPKGGQHFDVYQNYEIEAADRDRLQAWLEDRGVRTLVQWGGKPLHAHAELGFADPPVKTEEIFTRCLLLPCNTSLADEDVIYVSDAIREFYGAAPL